MANELLDFVMSLVRDPDVAARYAGNPQQAIADAHLTDVTSADVNNLIPVVSESLSMTAPSHGIDTGDANVWSSGAATAAFDAFSDHLPTPVTVDTHEPVIEHQVYSPVDNAVESWHDAVPELHTFDANPVDEPFSGTDGIHDTVPAVDHGAIDPDFDHPVGHHGFGDDLSFM
ncbi:MAG: hypothetical protein QOH57_1332 [Mycobacterium sp.]|jgi:hypothetical protein|nr:hypothetical protein [Mycobacterium sp.]